MNGACRGMDPEIFFSDKVDVQARAKQVCAGCAIRADCLDAALANREPYGVLGGMTARERWRLQRGLAPVVPLGRPAKKSQYFKLRVVS